MKLKTIFPTQMGKMLLSSNHFENDRDIWGVRPLRLYSQPGTQTTASSQCVYPI